jgi:hypothetical protein
MAEAVVVLAVATVVHGPKSAVVESTAMRPATESAVEPAAVATRMRLRKPAGDHQKYSRNPGTLGCAKRCVHLVLPGYEWDSLRPITIGLVLSFRSESEGSGTSISQQG